MRSGIYEKNNGREKKRREAQRKKKRIQELDGGEEEYEARRSLQSLSGVGSSTAGNLYEAGYKSASQARSASIEKLKYIEGIGEKLAADISREGAIKEWELGEDIPYEHYGEVVEHVKQLKRERRHEEAEELLLWAIDKAENERRPPPWYFKHLAIVYRKEKRYEDEVAIIERYIGLLEERNIEPKEVSTAAVNLVERIERARELAEQNQ